MSSLSTFVTLTVRPAAHGEAAETVPENTPLEYEIVTVDETPPAGVDDHPKATLASATRANATIRRTGVRPIRATDPPAQTAERPSYQAIRRLATSRGAG